MEVLFGAVVVVILIGIAYVVSKRSKLQNLERQVFDTALENRKLEDEVREFQESALQLQEELGKEREKNRYLLSQKKSSETRLGQISEHLVPFLENCPHDPKMMHFLGAPIDFIVFNLDDGAITFLEVKSGNSKPSKRQKTIRNIIKSGRVYYDEIRINEKGVKYKPHKNLEASSSLEDLDEEKGTEDVE